MQYNYRSRYLVTIRNEQTLDHVVNIYKYEKCKFQAHFCGLKPRKIFVGKNRICRNTKKSRACDDSDFNGNTFLL